jgi:cyclopropane-fatty-acyl-phospholipid synthase
MLEETIETQQREETKEEVKLASASKIYKNLFKFATKSMKNGSMRFLEPGNNNYVLGDINSPHEEYHNALVQINRPNEFYKKTVLFGDVGFSEAYMDGDWDTDNITNVLSWFLLNVDSSPSTSGSKEFKPHIKLMNFFNRMYHLYRSNTVEGSKRNIVEHYDLGNEFYKLFLDKTMTYSSAYFQKDEVSLEEAQVAKYEALCKHLYLKKEHHLLEIGSGWGGFSLHVAKKYGCRITTITISDEQFAYAKELFKREGVDHLIEIKMLDYRKLEGKFDRIVSIEMLEAVGDKYLDTYFEKCQSVLKPDGLLALQVITSPDSRYEEFKTGIDFIQKHIFPGSLLPSIGRINTAINRTGEMHLYHMHDMGSSYVKTLHSWLEMFDKNIAQVRALGFGEKFIRTWRYYLSYCEAAFKMRNISVVQLVYTRPNNLSL